MKDDKISAETTSIDTDNQGEQAVVEEEEFKVTVKKLEMPVRPRGVLAE
jgi:hypothetical protein